MHNATSFARSAPQKKMTVPSPGEVTDVLISCCKTLEDIDKCMLATLLTPKEWEEVRHNLISEQANAARSHYDALARGRIAEPSDPTELVPIAQHSDVQQEPPPTRRRLRQYARKRKREKDPSSDHTQQEAPVNQRRSTRFERNLRDHPKSMARMKLAEARSQLSKKVDAAAGRGESSAEAQQGDGDEAHDSPSGRSGDDDDDDADLSGTSRCGVVIEQTYVHPSDSEEGDVSDLLNDSAESESDHDPSSVSAVSSAGSESDDDALPKFDDRNKRAANLIYPVLNDAGIVLRDEEHASAEARNPSGTSHVLGDIKEPFEVRKYVVDYNGAVKDLRDKVADEGTFEMCKSAFECRLKNRRHPVDFCPNRRCGNVVDCNRSLDTIVRAHERNGEFCIRFHGNTCPVLHRKDNGDQHQQQQQQPPPSKRPRLDES